jgi:hypothetical protein
VSCLQRKPEGSLRFELDVLATWEQVPPVWVPQWLDMVFLKTWWVYQPRDGSLFTVAYHTFNLFEGAVWVVFAGLVLARYLKWRHSPLEIGYAAAFVSFGMTDFREAYALSSWLIWLKLANLIILLWCRARVIKRCYPAQKLF